MSVILKQLFVLYVFLRLGWDFVIDTTGKE